MIIHALVMQSIASLITYLQNATKWNSYNIFPSILKTPWEEVGVAS